MKKIWSQEVKKMGKEVIVAELLKKRAYMFLCSYKTAWIKWLEEEEKQGFTYEEVMKYINGTVNP